MTSDPGPRTFDSPRERPAPTQLTGHWANGDDAKLKLTALSLLVVIKANCDGCRDFLHSDLDEFTGLDVIFMSANEDETGEWVDASRPVLIAPDALAELEVKWPPFYVLVDPSSGLVRTEGVLFGPAQVAAEIAPFLVH